MHPGLGWRSRYSWAAIVEAPVDKPRTWYGGTDKRNVLPYPEAIPQADQHPTPKPVPLLEGIIRAAIRSLADAVGSAGRAAPKKCARSIDKKRPG